MREEIFYIDDRFALEREEQISKCWEGRIFKGVPIGRHSPLNRRHSSL